MAVDGKVIITCAITGAIHTPTMSPLPSDHAGRDHARGDRRGGGGRGDPAPACPRSRDRQARPDAGGLRPLPAAHQAGHECRDQHHDRRQPLYARRGARAAGGDVQAGGGLAQHGLDEFRPLSPARQVQGLQVRLGAAASRGDARSRLPQHASRTSSTSSRPATTTARASSSSATTSRISTTCRISPSAAS